MSREIKFRAWDKISKTMDYWQPFKYFDNSLVDPDSKAVETIMQYTGLKDKNGKEIYEGDILDINDQYNLIGSDIYEVVFSDGAFRIDGAELAILHNSPGCDALGEDTEVIGNIYENPELLGNLEERSVV